MTTSDESITIKYETGIFKLAALILGPLFFVYLLLHAEHWTISKMVLESLCLLFLVSAFIFRIYRVYIQKTVYILDHDGIHDHRPYAGLGFIPWSSITGIDTTGIQLVRVFINNSEEVINRQSRWRRFFLKNSNQYNKTPVLLSSFDTDITFDRFLDTITAKWEQYQSPGRKSNTVVDLTVRFKRIALFNDIVPWAVVLFMIRIIFFGKQILWVIVIWLVIIVPPQIIWTYRRIAKKTAYTFDDKGIHFHYGLYEGKTIGWKHVVKVQARSFWFPALTPGIRYFLLFVDNEKELTDGLNWFQRQLAAFNRKLFKTPVLIHANSYLDYSFDEIGTQIIDRLKKYQA